MTIPIPQDQQVMPLWQSSAPLAIAAESADVPALTFYPPSSPATGAAMIVCPGGGYKNHAAHEGEPIARWLAGLGIFAAVLKYRLSPRYRDPAPLMDASRALRLIRHHAPQWNIDPARIGILGASAGGHLACSLSVHNDAGMAQSEDPIERAGSRPDLAVLLYPVVTMGDKTHHGSRTNLLGENPSPDLIDRFSLETKISRQTPPMFIFHTVQDEGVPVENSLDLASALRKNGVLFELHCYEQGRHGVGLAGDDPVLSSWPKLAPRGLASINSPASIINAMRLDAERPLP